MINASHEPANHFDNEGTDTPDGRKEFKMLVADWVDENARLVVEGIANNTEFAPGTLIELLATPSDSVERKRSAVLNYGEQCVERYKQRDLFNLMSAEEKRRHENEIALVRRDGELEASRALSLGGFIARLVIVRGEGEDEPTPLDYQNILDDFAQRQRVEAIQGKLANGQKLSIAEMLRVGMFMGEDTQFDLPYTILEQNQRDRIQQQPE